MVKALVGFTYEMESVAEVAALAGVELVLSSQSERVAEDMGLPTLALPSFTGNPAAALQLDALIRDYNGRNRKSPIDVVWPLALSAFDLSAVTAVPVHAVASPATVALVNNKTNFAEWQRDLGDPTCPEGVETFGADATLARVMELVENHGVASVKPPNGVNGGYYTEVTPTAKPLDNPAVRKISPESYALELRRHEAENGPARWLVMEHLYGPELSVDALCIKGELKKWMVREKISDSRQDVYSDHSVIEHVRYIVAALELHGVVNVQYMYDEGGNLRYLEANVRPSGGCARYGEVIFDMIGDDSLLFTWWQWLAGMIDTKDITQWTGDKVTFRVRPTAFPV